MKCKDAERLMYLYRDGELDEIESRLLKTHAAECGQCREKLESIVLDTQKIRLSLSPVPEIPKEEHFAADVMRRLPSKGESRVTRPAPARRTLARPSFRFALAAVVCTVVSAFVYQSLTIFGDVRRIEERFASFDETAPREAAGYSIDVAALQKSETYVELLRTAGYFPQSGTTITISIEMIDALRSFLDRPAQTRQFAGTQLIEAGTQEDIRALIQSARFRVFTTSQL